MVILRWILIAVLLIIVVLLCMKIKIIFTYNNSGFSIGICIFRLIFIIYPLHIGSGGATPPVGNSLTPEEPLADDSMPQDGDVEDGTQKIKEKIKETIRDRKNKADHQTDDGSGADKEKKDYYRIILDAVPDVIKIIKDLGRTITIYKLYFKVIIATDDVAKTGMIFGQACAVCGILIPFVDNVLDVRDRKIHIDVNFEANSPEYDIEIILYNRLIKILFVLLKYLPRITDLVYKIIK